MELEKLPIWADIRKIFKDSAKPVRYENVGTIHTESEDIDIMKIVMIDNVRDYVNNIGDMVFIQFLMPLGDYITRLYPYRSNMELTIRRKPLIEVGQIENTSADSEMERFKVIFLVDENRKVDGNEYKSVDTHTLNNMEILTVKLQLINRALEPLRIKTTGGIFKNVYQKDLIQSVMLYESNQILIDGRPAVDGIDIVEPDNTERQRHVIIPHGTPISSIPTLCQEKMNGVYSSGIGTYLQSYKNKRIWFVYPLFNYERFDKNINKVIIYSVPKNRFPLVERTYRVEGDILYIAVTGDKAYQDTGEAALMDKGSGVRFTDARTIMGKPVQMTKDGPVGKRNQINNEVAIKARKDNLNYAPRADNAITSNPFAQFSRVAQRVGGRVDVTWDNSNIRLLHPGMPCKYVYTDGEKLVEKRGVILFAHGVERLDGQGIAVKSYVSTTAMTLFVEPSEDLT